MVHKALRHDISEEGKDAKGYDRLARQLVRKGRPEDARTVRGISEDERKHRRTLEKLYVKDKRLEA